MATPIRSSHRIQGALGDILVDVRTGDRGSPRPAVLIAHGFKGFKDFAFLPALADRLARAGFTAVTATISGAGVDDAGNFTLLDRFQRNTYSAELADLAAVLRALDIGEFDTVPPSSVGMLGFSRGGGAAVLLASQTPRISVLATWAAISRTLRWTAEEAAEWRVKGVVEVLNSRTGQLLPLGTELLDDVETNGGLLDILVGARRIAVPWLVVHGTADETVPFEEGEALARAAGDRATTLWIEGAGHTFGAVHPFAGMTPALSGAFDATVSHFARHLP
ncbi:MAG: alpha/beta hydrolase family protein [Gemmatimonadales bacterium]